MIIHTLQLIKKHSKSKTTATVYPLINQPYKRPYPPLYAFKIIFFFCHKTSPEEACKEPVISLWLELQIDVEVSCNKVIN